MTPIARRSILTTAAAALPLPFLMSCGLTASTATPLEMAKVYADALADAVSAAANTYLAGPPAPSGANSVMITLLVADLQTTRHALDSITQPADAKGYATQIVAFVQQLVPVVGTALGAAAPYVPLAIAVIQAFISALPVPPNTPAVPPAALRRQAAKYHAH